MLRAEILQMSPGQGASLVLFGNLLIVWEPTIIKLSFEIETKP